MIIDDSAVMRQLLNKFLSKDPQIEILASVSKAEYGICLIPKLKPDIITLDIEMPGMDGLTALTEIRKLYKLPVVMCSSLTLNGAAVTIEALNRGADDYVTKPSSTGERNYSFEEMSKDLLEKIYALVLSHRKKQSVALKTAPGPSSLNLNKKPAQSKARIELISIGISTGGPNALQELIPKLPKDFPVPIVLVQHMPPLFTNILAESLDKMSNLNVKEAKQGDVLRPGCLYIAPGNYHMVIVKEALCYSIALNQEEPENSCRPAVDVLFRSAAELFKENLLSIVMTGMGQDGMLGCKEVKAKGGYVVIQDEQSSVVWGMPGAVAKEGLADKQSPLSTLHLDMLQLVSSQRKRHE